MMLAVRPPQIAASDPGATVFVEANAGSGKTYTLVMRVARLLLDGVRPEAILCVTYTKAGAAEMQRRLFDRLGGWAVADDAVLDEALARIEETGRDRSTARALFARALETPGGLKIQTIHAFCEQLLRRFPLEAGVAPGFLVLEDAAARRVSIRAREDVAELALQKPDGEVAAAYAHFSVELDWASFNRMFADFEARRAAIAAHIDRCEIHSDFRADAWFRCGFTEPTSCAAIEAEAMSRVRWGEWKRRAEIVARGNGVRDQELAAKMRALGDGATFAQLWAILSRKDGEPLLKLGTQSVDAAVRAWLKDEQAKLDEVRCRLIAARVAEDTVHALALARAYIGLYEGEKNARGALDFGDLIDRAHALLTVKADAAWVLYKLDGGLDHVLLDEAQDTSPEQWDILRALTGEFFVGAGARGSTRTLFTVGDAKQSIFSFQGAAPERLALETQAFSAAVTEAGLPFQQVQLLESWRSTPEILSLVDAVFAHPKAVEGLRPGTISDNVVAMKLKHNPTREDRGCVELWPIEAGAPAEEADPWDAPVDAEPGRGPNKALAGRIAMAVQAMVRSGDGVLDRDTGTPRPTRYADVLILVRRRGALFDEIIRALKREGVPVAGADRLKLAEHGVFEDLLAIGRFACFSGDDLTLAGLLRGPFCDVDEQGLFDLAHNREGSLWGALRFRRNERPEWREAAGFLAWAEAEAASIPPFDFYSRVLGRLDPRGRSMRQRILTRLGAEAEEALDAFLAQALDAETRGDRDLETFVAAMATSELEIKREQDESREDGPGEVRVMTVHGAKGLEAPVVILPDTTTRATAQGGALLDDGQGGFLWAPRKADDCDCSAEARRLRDVATEHESARLLYVALTRARDRLIVCGVETQPKRFENSWYALVQRGVDDLPIHPFDLPGGGEGWRYGADPAPVQLPLPGMAPVVAPPAWAIGLAPPESPSARYASPSGPFESAEKSAPSPLAESRGLGRYRRGDIIHRLLQILPDLPPPRRAEATARMLARERDLTDDQREEMASAALRVLEDPAFAAVFGPGSRAEVALAGTAPSLSADLKISARVDRLLVERDRVLVVDFKTNRPAPDVIESADPAYILQMALYTAVLAEAFSGRRVEAALVWTDGPKLMPVPEALMAASLDALRVGPT